jgi:hypothetical protein
MGPAGFEPAISSARGWHHTKLDNDPRDLHLVCFYVPYYKILVMLKTAVNCTLSTNILIINSDLRIRKLTLFIIKCLQMFLQECRMRLENKLITIRINYAYLCRKYNFYYLNNDMNLVQTYSIMT